MFSAVAIFEKALNVMFLNSFPDSICLIYETLKSAFIKAVGNKADYDIILSAAEWVDNGVLTELDIADIQATIDEQYNVSNEEFTDTNE